MKTYTGNIVDVINRKIFKGSVIVENGIISEIIESDNDIDNYIMPGFVDSHVHIESSMLIPSIFAGLAVKSGTVATVSDPHEIANVLGVKGVDFMIENASKTPLKIFFTVPSCVPATEFETAGAVIEAKDIDSLLEKLPVKILGEVMNFPGVIFDDKNVHEKINVAKKHNAIIDGHIPGVSGDDLKKYINTGISTDHECFSYDEAVEKIKLGMTILIREGSAARNFDTLYPLISEFNNMCMLCTDDSHPDDIIKYGHIDKIVKMGLNKDINIFDILTTASVNPVKHYKLPVGLLQKNDPADFIIVKDLKNIEILETIINGEPVYSYQRLLFNSDKINPINKFNAEKISAEKISVEDKNTKIKVIEVIDKELITKSFSVTPKTEDGKIVSDIDKDILKIVVYNRYDSTSRPMTGFINGFGLKSGAIAGSVAHDSHNIIAVGTNDTDIVNAINEIVEHKGGLCFVNGMDYYSIPLEFGGLMTQENPYDVANKYEILNKQIKTAGSNLTSPFMTLSFMALLVIPELKIGDKGLFDITKFDFVNLYDE